MEIPGLGSVTKDLRFGFYESDPMPIPALGEKECRVAVEDYDDDPNKDEFHVAIANFLSIDSSVLRVAEEQIFRYYKKCNDDWDPDDEEYIAIKAPHDVWDHIQLGDQPAVRRRAYGDKAIYVLLECNCDWEPEHGLQIVFQNGLTVNKVGPYDGHLTNSDAYDDDSLEHVVYR